MTTKIVKRNDIPAGILPGSGIEVFVNDQKAYAMDNGVRKDYLSLPLSIRIVFSKAFKRDWKLVVKLWPNVSPNKAFIQWLSCKCGKLDGTPDIDELSNEIVADNNSFCGDCYCAGAGKLCKLPYGLKPDQIATIQLVKQGFTREQIANVLHRSPEAIKSRLEKSKIHFGAHNVAHLSSLTSLI